MTHCQLLEAMIAKSILIGIYNGAFFDNLDFELVSLLELSLLENDLDNEDKMLLLEEK